MTATASDLAAGLRAVLLAPEDDGPRLVYADMLEERGDGERAELIRVQCKMARCRMCHRKDGTKRRDSYAAHCGRCVPGSRRAADLLDKARAWWLPPMLPYESAGIGLDPLQLRTLLWNQNVNFEFSRGFVSHVTCPLATLMDGRCGSCLGTGAIERLDSGYMRRFGLREWNGCKTCGGDGYDKRGSGRTPGIAAALWSSQPVTGVRVSDREPQTYGFDAHGWFNGQRSDRGDEPFSLPMDLWALLSGGSIHNRWRDYETPDLAHAALSAACVLWGRRQAGMDANELGEM